MLDLVGIDFKYSYQIYKELTGNIFKELKENMIVTPQ